YDYTLVSATPSVASNMNGSNRLLFSSLTDKGVVVSYFSASLATSRIGVVDKDTAILPGTELRNDTILITQSYSSENTVLHLHSGSISYDGGNSWNDLPNMPTPYFQGSSRVQFQSAITDTNGSVILVGTPVNVNPHGLVYSSDGGSS